MRGVFNCARGFSSVFFFFREIEKHVLDDLGFLFLFEISDLASRDIDFSTFNNLSNSNSNPKKRSQSLAPNVSVSESFL